MTNALNNVWRDIKASLQIWRPEDPGKSFSLCDESSGYLLGCMIRQGCGLTVIDWWRNPTILVCLDSLQMFFSWLYRMILVTWKSSGWRKEMKDLDFVVCLGERNTSFYELLGGNVRNEKERRKILKISFLRSI